MGFKTRQQDQSEEFYLLIGERIREVTLIENKIQYFKNKIIILVYY